VDKPTSPPSSPPSPSTPDTLSVDPCPWGEEYNDAYNDFIIDLFMGSVLGTSVQLEFPLMVPVRGRH